MSRHHQTIGFLFVAALVLNGPQTYAQRGTARRGADLVMVAGCEAVQKEIGVEGSVATKVQSIISEHDKEERDEQESMFKDAQLLMNLGREEREKRSKEILDREALARKKRAEKTVSQLQEALSTEQFERVQQIAWQAGGSEALATDPRLVKSLELTDDQIKKIAAINIEYRQKKRGQFGLGGGFQAALARERESNKERDGKAAEVLTKEQQEKLAKLTGKPFDLALLMPPS